MAKEKKGNKFAKNAKKQELMHSVIHGLDTKGSIKNSGLETLRDVLVGVVGGGLIGAAIGKPSLFIGFGVTGAGHYIGNRSLSLLGIGMMAANGFQQSKSVQGLEGMDMQSIKDRMNAYKENFMEKTYLDRFMHKGAATEESNGKKAAKQELPAKGTASGFGELQFFNYPNDVSGNEFDALEQIHNRIQQSGMAHMEQNGIPGEETDGTDGTEGFGDLAFADIAEYNL